MREYISEPIVVSLDVRCTVEGCTCFREAVEGRILKDGGSRVIADANGNCPACSHPNEKHRVEGETKSDYEKKYGNKPI